MALFARYFSIMQNILVVIYSLKSNLKPDHA